MVVYITVLIGYRVKDKIHPKCAFLPFHAYSRHTHNVREKWRLHSWFVSPSLHLVTFHFSQFQFCPLRVFRRRRRRRRSSPGAPRRYYRRSVANFSGPEWGKVSTDSYGSWRGGICQCTAIPTVRSNNLKDFTRQITADNKHICIR